jgi:1-acyl-sn-glycerol-3-phosphate acyltransferase
MTAGKWNFISILARKAFLKSSIKGEENRPRVLVVGGHVCPRTVGGT